jgi:hypothetical protein
MATTYSTAVYANKQPAVGGSGVAYKSTHLHAVSGTITTWAINDVINVGYLPAGAVVVSTTMKASAQLDTNGAPALTLDLGVTGTAQLFKAAVTTVGRVSGVSVDTTIAAAGMLYKNTGTTDIAVIATVHAAAATAGSGTLEFDIEYYVEPPVGSNP